MKNIKTLSLSLMLSLITLFSAAQISQGGQPLSFSLDAKAAIPSLQLPAPDMAVINAQDEANSNIMGKRYRVGVSIDANVNPSNSGIWNYFPDGSAIWQLKIGSENAQSLGLNFSDFYLPEGAKFFVYTPDQEFIIGAFTSFNNPKDNVWATQMLPGDEIVLELFLENANDAFSLEISKLAYFYRSSLVNKNTKGDSGSCQVNVACSEGTNYQNQERGVVRIQIYSEGSYFLCTGSLVNNTNDDCTPYVLSADHCSVSESYEPATASEYNQWVFYFLYQSNSCTGQSHSYGSKTITGCTHRASDTYGETGSSNSSDFLLVELNNSVPSNYTPYFNGWTTANVAVPTNSVCIHHPSGDIKKISTVNEDLLPENYGSNMYPCHHYVTWKSTTNGYGVTEGGSSGSPLFNTSGLIAGTLTGGSSLCSTPEEPDIFGRMSKHWTYNGTSSDKQLKPWLNPTSSSVTQLNGRFVCTVGMNDLQYVDANITSYPNPAVSTLNVDFTNYNTEATIYITNIVGNVVTPATKGEFTGIHSIDISTLAPGMYYVIIISDQGKIAKEFVKE